MVIALAWGTIRVLVNRDIGVSYHETNYDSSYDEENDWGFGQVLVLSMLIIPIMSLSELYYGKKILSMSITQLFQPILILGRFQRLFLLRKMIAKLAATIQWMLILAAHHPFNLFWTRIQDNSMMTFISISGFENCCCSCTEYR